MVSKTSFRLIACTLAMACALPAIGQERVPGSYDDRWYITGGAGANHQDDDRDTENASFGTIGVGKFINPNWSVDAELNYQNPKANRDEDLNFSQYGISIDARRHFRKDGRRFNPYLVGGIGYQRAEEEFDAFPSPDSPGQDSRGYATAKLGAGVQADFQRFSLRGELAARHSFDRDSVVSPGSNGFTDTLAHVSVVVPLGTLATSSPTPAPVPVDVPETVADCEHMDSDGDGANDCQDQCPQSQAGQTVGPDGCPVPLTIDLRGANFAFDSDQLNDQAYAILDEAVEILNRHPSLRVEVAGHTDSIGSDAYNQALSERRARVVYEYLAQRGISRERMSGPNGYGESQPIAPNTHPDGSDNPEGRAQNRRTELRSQQ